MPDVEWVGQSVKDDDAGQMDPSRLINCYRETLGGAAVIKSVLGTVPFASMDGVLMRSLTEIAGFLYAVIDGKLNLISSTGLVTQLGEVGSSPETTISGNNGTITVAANGTYYAYRDGVLSQPVTPAFTDIGSVSYIGQTTVLTERGGRRVAWSGVADATAFDALDVATTEQRDDNNIRGLPVGGLFWIFKERSIERWYVDGSASFFSPVSGGVIDTGLKAFGLVSEIPNGVFFVGDDNIVYLASGGQLTPISSRGVETALASGSATNAFYTEDEGHKFCTIRFSDRPAWVYDISSLEWHERAEGGELSPWSATTAAQAYGRTFVGTNLGYVFELARTNQDANDALVRVGVSRTLEVQGRRFVVSRMQIYPRMGRSFIGRAAASVLDIGGGFVLAIGGAALKIAGFTAAPRDAKVGVQISKDRGETWGRSFTRSLGDQGQYRKSVVMRSLGQYETFNAKFTISDAAEIPLMAKASVDLS